MLAVVQPFSASTPDVAHRRPNISSSTASSRSVSANLAPNPPPSLQRHQTAPPTVPAHTRTPTPPPKAPEPVQDAPFDINVYPPSDLLKLLALLLTHIATTNDPLSLSTAGNGNASHAPHPPPPEPLDAPPIWHTLTTASRNAISTPAATLTFHARNIPTISLEAYLMRILKYCPTSNHVFLSLLVYFDRMSKLSEDAVGRAFIIDSYNIHRLVIAGVTVASKFFSDVFYTNSRYAKVGGLPLPELNQLELQFLLLNDFRLVISSTEMQHYAEQLILFSDSTVSPNGFPSGTSTSNPPSASAPSSAVRLPNGHSHSTASDPQPQPHLRHPVIPAPSSTDTARSDSIPTPTSSTNSSSSSSSSSSSTIVGSVPHSHSHSHPHPHPHVHPHAHVHHPAETPSPSVFQAPVVPSYSAVAASSSSTPPSSFSYTHGPGPTRPLDAMGGVPVPAPAHIPTNRQAFMTHSPGYVHAHQQQQGMGLVGQMYSHAGYPMSHGHYASSSSSTSTSSSSLPLAPSPSSSRPLHAHPHGHAHSASTSSFSGAENAGGDGDAEDDADTSTDAGTETSTDDEPTVRAPGTVFGGGSVGGSVWGGDEDPEDDERERERERMARGGDALMRSP